MENKTHFDKSFQNIDSAGKSISGRSFENCRFFGCNFSAAQLSNNDFIDCHFENCDLTMAVIENTGLKTIAFINCKLMGIDFSKSKDFLFAVRFESCLMDFVSFIRKKMPKTHFLRCQIKEANFTDCDLSSANFAESTLERTIFQNTNLSKADFRQATQFSIDPQHNKLKKARFSTHGLIGLLDQYDIVVE